MHELIGDITLCILFAWGLGLLAHFSRQPLILSYLIAGFFIGPFGMGWVKSQESISIISELGLIFMLFMIGLEIDLKKIVRAGKVILFAAGGQLVGGCLLGMGRRRRRAIAGTTPIPRGLRVSGTSVRNRLRMPKPPASVAGGFALTSSMIFS